MQGSTLDEHPRVALAEPQRHEVSSQNQQVQQEQAAPSPAETPAARDDAMEAVTENLHAEVEASAIDDPYGAAAFDPYLADSDDVVGSAGGAVTATAMGVEDSDSEEEQDPDAFRACLAGACTDDIPIAGKDGVG